jgi:TatD DNase family protein
MSWIDTHCHLDAREFDADRQAVVQRARDAGVHQIVLPAVAVWNFQQVRELAHEHRFSYALGIHPLCVDDAHDEDLTTLRAALQEHIGDPRLVGIGEIGLDHFVEGLDRAKQERFYEVQLKLAVEFELPVIVHVRRSADTLLKHLRRIPAKGIAHAFNGSEQQAQIFIDLGFKLGFGGAMTFDRALQIRRLAATVPDEAIVLETDAPDIPPHWLYKTAEQRAHGETSRNESAQLPRIAQTLTELRGWSIEDAARITTANAHAALPRLAALAPTTPHPGERRDPCAAHGPRRSPG